jgi:hypothetical protein
MGRAKTAERSGVGWALRSRISFAPPSAEGALQQRVASAEAGSPCAPMICRRHEASPARALLQPTIAFRRMASVKNKSAWGNPSVRKQTNFVCGSEHKTDKRSSAAPAEKYFERLNFLMRAE